MKIAGVVNSAIYNEVRFKFRLSIQYDLIVHALLSLYRMQSALRKKITFQGCTDKILEALMSQTTIIAAIAIGVGILELSGVFFALALYRAIGSSERYKA